ncbi:MAG TPA: ATP-binding protein [Candidatus Kapabacteria bacterium]|nr:ATP-binding protein [Candidatus Kapabacteria bacterium]
MPVTGIRLRVRTAAFIAGAFSLLLTTYFAISYLSIKSSLISRSDTEVLAALDKVVASLSADSQRIDLPTLASRYGNTGEAIIGFKIISGSDKRIAATGPAIVQSLLDSGQFIFRQLPMNIQVGESPIRVFGKTLGRWRVLAAINTIAFQEVFEAMLRTYLIILAIGIFLSFIIAIATADLALKPLKLLVQSALQIRQDQVSTILPTTTKTREINELAILINDILSERNRNIDRLRNFTADAAHELRTPLTILRGELEVDLRIKQLSADEREALESNLEEVRRLIRIVEDLMILARAEQASETTKTQSWKLSELVTEILTRLDPLITSKQISIIRSDNINSEYKLSRTDTERILYNILLNALQYSSDGKSIYLSSEMVNGRLAYHVRDEGMGISQKDIPHIFDRFWRADTSRSRVSGGIGLGLSIVKTFADRLGIQIVCKSTVGTGTTITCFFPAA